MLLTALLLTATADVLPPGHRDIDCHHEVVGLEAAPGVRWGLYPEGTSFDDLDWLEAEEGALRFRFYAASSPFLWAIPEGIADAVTPEVLAGPGEPCEARCADAPDALGCALCGASEADYLSGLGLARTEDRLQMCDAVPESSPLVGRVLRRTVQSVEGGRVQASLELLDRTEADVMAEKQAERAAREAERAAYQEAERDSSLRQAMLLVGMSSLLVIVGFLLRRQVSRMQGR